MAWHGLACLRRQQGDPQAYHASVKKAFLVLPESREIAIAFHDSGLSSGNLEDTESAFREVLARRPMDRRLRFFLIDILLRRSRFAEAMAEIESALVDFGVDEGMLAAALNIRARLGPLSISSGFEAGRQRILMHDCKERGETPGALPSQCQTGSRRDRHGRYRINRPDQGDRRCVRRACG